MNTLEIINANGFLAGMDIIVNELQLSGYLEAGEKIRADFDSEKDLDILKPFAVIMEQETHVVDVEDKMIELMGEDEYFDMVG